MSATTDRRSRIKRPAFNRSVANGLSAAAILGMLAAGLQALTPLISLGVWMWKCLGTAALVFALSYLFRSVGARTWVASGLAALAAVVVLIFTYAGETAILGVIPTFDTVNAIADLLAQAQTTIVHSVAPARADEGLTFALVAIVALIAVLSDVFAFALRMPLLTALAPLACLITPPLVFSRRPEGSAWLLMAIAFVMLLWASAQARRHDAQTRRTLVRSGVVVLVVAALVAPVAIAVQAVLPRQLQFAWSPFTSSDFTLSDDPFVTVSQSLRENGAAPVFRYTASTFVNPYFKLANIVDLDGATWRPDALSADREVDTPGRALERSGLPNVNAPVTHVTVTIEGLRSNWLPVPYVTTAIEFDGSTHPVTWDPLTMSAQSAVRIAPDTQYTLGYQDSRSLIDRIRENGAWTYPGGNDVLDRALAIPDDTPDNVRDFAEQFRQFFSPLDQAEAIVQRFAQSDFRYSEAEPVAEGFDRAGMDTIGAFLENKAGYCVHFASTMVIVARLLGIPARIAVGYLPGSGRSLEEVTVTRDDMHAWPELYFPGTGWVQFEPTPAVSNGSIDHDEATEPGPSASPTESETGDASPSASPSDDASPAPSITGPIPDLDDQDGPDALSSTPAIPAWVAPSLGVLALLVVLLTGPRVARGWIRRRRFARGSPQSLWDEVVCTAIDCGLAADPARTPRAVAAAIEEMFGQTRDLAPVREAYETSQYARPSGAASVDRAQLRAHAEGCIQSIRGHAPRGIRRTFARLFPRSLWAGRD